MPTIAEKLIALQNQDRSKVRNICILAHVDHGKTTLADSLVASNGFISQRLAGQLRYLDSRQDEQERGITMKSSAVTLSHNDHVINLIDSPGHVDFSSEVSTAVRLCDGAIVLVDVVEGVQPQTEVVLKQAWLEGIKPILVLNKMDRLITEMKLTPIDAHVRLVQVLEGVNAVIGNLFAADVMKENEDNLEDGLDDADDSDLYFSPERGNVLFASAYDGWAFDLPTFAEIYAKRFGFSEKALCKTLWGDYFINSKTKEIVKGAASKAKKVLFVSLILENIWTLYESILVGRDNEKVQKIVNQLNIKVSPRDMKTNDSKQKLSAIFSQWLPLANVLLKTVIQKLPSPKDIKEERAEQLMCSKAARFDTLPTETQALKNDFLNCDPDSDDLIVYISKMFAVPKKQLPHNRPKPMTPEEMARRREAAKQRLLVAKANTTPDPNTENNDLTGKTENSGNDNLTEKTENLMEELKLEERDLDGTAFIAFARVFSGTLKPGQTVYVLGPKYEPLESLDKLKNGQTDFCDPNATIKDAKQNAIMQAKIGNLYLLLGRELEELQEAKAGNIVGIGGLENYILKSATISTNIACTPFIEITQSSAPILRVAIEPEKSSDLNALVQGLHLLNQADANVQVFLNDKGEHILLTAGEVHLERCIRDLKETYAGVQVVASSPIVPFRETIIDPPKTDMVNEELNEENKVIETEENSSKQHEQKIIVMQTPNKQCTVSILAVPMPNAAVKLIEDHKDLLKAYTSGDGHGGNMKSESLAAFEEFQDKLEEIFNADHHVELHQCAKRILAYGPKKIGPNILVNKISIEDFNKTDQAGDENIFKKYEASLNHGFQLVTMGGPLCEEPLMGCAFVITKFSLDDSEKDVSNDLYGPLSGQIVSIGKKETIISRIFCDSVPKVIFIFK